MPDNSNLTQVPDQDQSTPDLPKIRQRKRLPLEQRKLRPLTNKELAFHLEYSRNGFNATEAALKTYNCKSRPIAGQIGHQCLKKLKLLKERQASQSQESLRRLKSLESDKFIQSSIRSEITEDEIISRLNKLSLNSRRDSDKLKATELLGKWKALNLWRDNSVIETNVIHSETETDLDQAFRNEIRSRALTGLDQA